jgi:two-component system response regulator AdeR
MAPFSVATVLRASAEWCASVPGDKLYIIVTTECKRMAVDPSVLIVDDEQIVAGSYSDHLTEEYDVTVTYSGEAALEEIGPEIDVVLLDRRMPGLSGDEVLRAIQDRGVDCRIVMVTAVEPDIDIVEMDFDEYLVKPVTGDQLRDVVDRMAARKSLDERIQRIFALASKLATLESKLTHEQLHESDEYAKLRREFDQLRDGTDLPAVEEDPYFEAAVENVEALLR